MKNLAYFLVFVVTAFACSSDDDGVPPPPQPIPFSAYINSGGPAISVGGNDWVIDDAMQNSDAADIFSSTDPDLEIEGTDNDDLYRTEVFELNEGGEDGVFTYNIAVPGNATLEVKLHFAEIFHGVDNGLGIGARIFNVDIEGGQASLTDYDIIAQAGAAATAKVETFSNISVTDGNLTITFTADTDGAKVNAVEVSGTYLP